MQDTTKQNTIKQDGHANQENWRIDEEILPTSQWRLLIVAFWFGDGGIWASMVAVVDNAGSDRVGNLVLSA